MAILVEEAYFAPLNHRDSLHNIHSCTKSFTSALVGIALDKGLIKDLNQKVVDFFPEINITKLDEWKKNITIENLLTMTSGFDWPEWESSGKENPTDKLAFSVNWVEFMLNTPMKQEPGKYWNYNSGASHLLSAIVHKVCKMDEKDFIEQNLFNPLGISNYTWGKDRDDNYIGGWDLSLTPMDMAKFGYLYLKNGRWKDRQIISKDWVKASTQLQFNFRLNNKNNNTNLIVRGYGYHFWILNFEGFIASGAAGQYIMVFPGKDLVVVFTGSLHNDVEPQLNTAGIPFQLTCDYILKSIVNESSIPERQAKLSNHLKLLGKKE